MTLYAPHYVSKTQWTDMGMLGLLGGLAIGVSIVVARSAWFSPNAVNTAEMLQNDAIDECETSASQVGAEADPKDLPLFVGIRVLDISCSSVGEILGKTLTELGAEVMHVRPVSALSQSYWYIRDLLNGQPLLPRNWDGLDKHILGVNPNDKAHCAALRSTLSNADVVIGFNPENPTKPFGIDMKNICNECPHLILADLSQWGSKGDMKNQVCNDMAPFWSASSLGTSIYGRESTLYALYPVGLGEVVSCQSLLSAISLALYHRKVTGQGSMANSSVLHNGIWCASTAILANPKHHTKKNPMHCIYRTADGVDIILMGMFGRNPEEASAILLYSFCPGNMNPATLRNVNGHEILASQFMLLSCDAVGKRLDALGVVWRRCTQGSYPWVVKYQDEIDYGGSRKETIPYSFQNKSQPSVRPARSQTISKQECCVTTFAWGPVHPTNQLPKSTSLRTAQRMHLNVTIVELVDWNLPFDDLSIPFATKGFVSLGANVIHLEPRQGDALRERDRNIYRQCNSGKRIIRVGDLHTVGNDQIRNVLRNPATFFVTNFSESRLRALALDKDTLQVDCPDLSFIRVQPYDSERMSEMNRHSALGVLYGASGLASGFDARASRPEAMGLCHDVCDGIASLYISACISMCIFHRFRRAEGQLARVSFERIGAFTRLMLETNEFVRDYTSWFEDRGIFEPEPLLAMRTFHTKDHVCLQFSECRTLFSLARLIRALHVRWKLYPKLFVVWCTATADYIFKRSRFVNLNSVYQLCVSTISAAIAALPYAKFAQIANRYNLKFIVVRSPDDMIGFEQALQNAMFETLDDGIGISSPVSIKPRRLLA